MAAKLNIPERFAGAAVAATPREGREETTYVGVRLPLSLCKDLDQEAVALMEEFPSLEFTRSDVVRMGLREFMAARNKAKVKLRSRVRKEKKQ